jgi:hypothetical protein
VTSDTKEWTPDPTRGRGLSLYSATRGKPGLTLGAVGRSNSDATLDNDGADYGPDTLGSASFGVQDAINAALTSGGGRLCLLGGNFYGLPPLSIVGNNLKLSGPPSSHIQLVGSSSSNLLTIGDGTNTYGGIILDGFELDGNSTSSEFTVLFSGSSSASGVIQNSTIQNCYVHGGNTTNGNGIFFNATVNCRALNNTCPDMWAGININDSGVLTQHSSANLIQGNTCNGNVYGIVASTYGPGATAIDSNFCNSNSKHGISIDSANGLTMTNNILSGNGNQGMRLATTISSPCGGNNIIGNQFISNAEGGLFLGNNGQTYDTLVANNSFVNNYTGSSSGWEVINAGLRNHFVGNHFYEYNSAIAYAIRETTGASQALYADNYFVNQGSSSAVFILPLAGSGSRIINNLGFNPFGLIGKPFATATLTPVGTNANPAASTTYTIEHVRQSITTTGGSGVSITVKDAAANTLVSGASSLSNYFMDFGFTVNFGAFTVSPTVTSIGY